MQVNTKEFAELTNTDYTVARGGLLFLHSQGAIKEIRRDKPAGPGRPTIVYDVPSNIVIELRPA